MPINLYHVVRSTHPSMGHSRCVRDVKVENGIMKWMESGEVIKVMDKVKSQHRVSFGRDVEFECVVNHVEKEFGKCFIH
jgi:hypothetical protein